jgi:hypothetical protein
MTMEAHAVPEVREAYLEYTPPFDVAAVVRDLLSYVPAEYLSGLKCVVLLNASGRSRRDRRRRIASQGKRHLAGTCLGFYHGQHKGAPAHIEIHVDRVIQRAGRLALLVSAYRDSLFAWTLYHELGHHIHQVLHPQHREPENVANDWAERLRNAMLRQKYHSLTQEEWARLRDVAAKLQGRQRRTPRTLPTARSEGGTPVERPSVVRGRRGAAAP